MPLTTKVTLDPIDIVLDGVPALPLQKGAEPLQFLAHVCCGQTAGWINMPLGMNVVLGPGHIVLDGDPALLPSERAIAFPYFSAMCICGQTVAHLSNHV